MKYVPRRGTADLPGTSIFFGPSMVVGSPTHWTFSAGQNRKPVWRFLVFLIPIFVVASMLGLGLVSNVFLRAERDSVNKRISTFTTRIASVLKGKPNGRRQPQCKSRQSSFA